MKIGVRFASRSLKLTAAACILGLAACTLGTDTQGSYILGVNSGNNQTVAAGAQLTAPLTVIIYDPFGGRAAGLDVHWAIEAGGGSLSAATTTTGLDGIASVTYTAGPTPLTASITATVPGIGTVAFNETIT